ncbi:hypothetical protein GCM10010358_77560 [Streptomyces minutiscleroticus]|uniref:HTH merR-type domain-containing protein n=1 Tax=Streptomyces minutiscleroticus TaxID=68238 RepID=A0A918P298_9ACTN|nr:hypothetical protein GCM10010358_77560 [Streptomyces minutiscleroticus]
MQNTWSIGELAEMAGLSVKTIRYYSDSGLLPVAERSTGGHRRYGPQALNRLRLIRQLRSLEIPIAAITEVVTGERSLGDLMTGELLATQERLSQLRWRQATLQALDDCPPDVRLNRLQILSRVHKLPEARQALTHHWAHSLPADMPKRWRDRMVALLSPSPPDNPSATSALAYAELHLLIAAPGFTRWTQDHKLEMRDAPSFYAQVDHAAELTIVSLLHGLPPGQGGPVPEWWTPLSPAPPGGGEEGSLMVMKVYSPEFKADAVALYLSDPSHTFEGIGKDLGISRETLRNWVRAERVRRGESGTTNTKEVPVSEATRQELEAEIAALRAELKTVRKENQKLATERDILRKATKFFAQEMTW